MIVNEAILHKVAEKSILNAESLMADADLLKKNKRFERAYTLYQLSLEEVGKAISSILLLFIPDALTAENIKEYKKTFFQHSKKTKKSAGMDHLVCQVLYNGNAEGAMSFLEQSISENEMKLDKNKNDSLYTAIIGNEVKNPSEMIDEEMLNYICFRAKSRYNAAFQFIKAALMNYQELREYSKSYKAPNPEEFAKQFWDELLESEKISN